VNAVGTALPAHLLPTIAALIAALVSVASGSSWGAMVLLFPTVQSCIMRHTRHTDTRDTDTRDTDTRDTDTRDTGLLVLPSQSICPAHSFLCLLGIAVGAKGGGLEGRSNVLIKVNNLPYVLLNCMQS
jgi:hypothetical protein